MTITLLRGIKRLGEKAFCNARLFKRRGQCSPEAEYNPATPDPSVQPSFTVYYVHVADGYTEQVILNPRLEIHIHLQWEPSKFWRGAHLLITFPLPEQQDIVEWPTSSIGVRITWINCMSSVEDPAIYHDADIIATLGALPPSRSACPKLKLVHSITAGVDYVSKSPIFGDPSIRWTYSSGIHGAPMAEWVFMTYMAFQKEWDVCPAAQRNRDWDFHFDAMRTRDSVGQRMGIMRYGSIVRQIARVAQAMGIEVLALTATENKTKEDRREMGYRLPGMGDPEGEILIEWFFGLAKEALHKFLAARIDVLVISLPLTEQTRGMLGKEEFDVLAKHSPCDGAFISNIARGEFINQDELIAALKTEGSGVCGAALDVSIPEPLPLDSPLWEAPNCFITPHNSSQNIKYMSRGLQIMVEDLRKPLDSNFINEVNTVRCYSCFLVSILRRLSHRTGMHAYV